MHRQNGQPRFLSFASGPFSPMKGIGAAPAQQRGKKACVQDRAARFR
jgi:hypothetical protein